MKDNLSNIPELNLDKTEHFYVVGTKNRDGIVAGNYKADLKKGIGDSGALINTISGMSENDKAVLREALGVGGDTSEEDSTGKILIIRKEDGYMGRERLTDEQITAAGVDIDTFMAGKYIAMKIIDVNGEWIVYPLNDMYSETDVIRATFGEMALGKNSNGWYLYSTA